MRSIGFALTAVVLMGTTTAAFAEAVVSPESGSVLVSHGQGFARHAQPVNLVPGDRVMVAQGNRGKISYPDGCSVELLPGSVVIIKAASPCIANVQNSPLGAQIDHDLIGYGVAGGAVALGTIAAIISLDEKNAPFPRQPSPVSP